MAAVCYGKSPKHRQWQQDPAAHLLGFALGCTDSCVRVTILRWYACSLNDVNIKTFSFWLCISKCQELRQRQLWARFPAAAACTTDPTDARSLRCCADGTLCRAGLPAQIALDDSVGDSRGIRQSLSGGWPRRCSAESAKGGMLLDAHPWCEYLFCLCCTVRRRWPPQRMPAPVAASAWLDLKHPVGQGLHVAGPLGGGVPLIPPHAHEKVFPCCSSYSLGTMLSDEQLWGCSSSPEAETQLVTILTLRHYQWWLCWLCNTGLYWLGGCQQLQAAVQIQGLRLSLAM